MGIEDEPRLLIVEDDPLVLRVVVRVARSRGIAHLATGLVSVALETIEVGPLIGLVTDYDLGDERTGLDVLAAVRSRWPGAKRVLMSGSPPEVLEAARVAGLAHRIMRKPFATGELGEVLDWIAA